MFWIVVLLIIIAALSALCLSMKYHLVDKQVRIDRLFKSAELNKKRLEEANAECNLTQRRLDLADEQLSDIRAALNKGD